jgi:thiol-disulfide isomerase/thioredoxin
MRPNYAGRNRRAPDFALTSSKGSNVHLSQYRGKTVVLNFWTTTCQPCLEEMPSLAELAEILKKRKDVEVVTISTDAIKETADSALKTLLHKPEPPFTSSTIRIRRSSKTSSARLVSGNLIIDLRVIRARFDGARDRRTRWCSISSTLRATARVRRRVRTGPSVGSRSGRSMKQPSTSPGSRP